MTWTPRDTPSCILSHISFSKFGTRRYESYRVRRILILRSIQHLRRTYSYTLVVGSLLVFHGKTSFIIICSNTYCGVREHAALSYNINDHLQGKTICSNTYCGVREHAALSFHICDHLQGKTMFKILRIFLSNRCL